MARVAEAKSVARLHKAEADTADDYAFVGNYSDLFPMEDLDEAARDPLWMADVSGAAFTWGSVGLGVGDALAMRGTYVAGVDGGAKLVRQGPTPPPAVAVRWTCVRSAAAVHPCARGVLGPGVAYGVDSVGEVVGDDEPRLSIESGVLRSAGHPVFWRRGGVVRLSDRYGAAYAISKSGLIVGTLGGKYRNGFPLFGEFRGFIASARDRYPRARSLDPLVSGLAGRHVLAAFAVSDSGNILAIVGNDRDDARLAILAAR